MVRFFGALGLRLLLFQSPNPHCFALSLALCWQVGLECGLAGRGPLMIILFSEEDADGHHHHHRRRRPDRDTESDPWNPFGAFQCTTPKPCKTRVKVH